MKPPDKDMLSLLVAVITAILLLWGSDALTDRLIQRSSIAYTATIASLLPTNSASVIILVVLLLMLLCAVLSF